MVTRNTDVNLIVRARTEGEKAIAGLAGALDNLFDDARAGAGDLAELGKTLGALDKAAATIASSMEKAGSAVDRQRASIRESNAAYAALVQQRAEAQRVLQSFGDQANPGFVGPRTETFTRGYGAIRAEVDRLDTSIQRLFTTIGTQNAQLEGTQSSLIKLSATSQAIAQGQAQAEAQIELTNQRLREQAAAGERVTEIQQRINDITGVNRPDARGNASAAADILLTADAEYRRVEALREQAAAQQIVNNALAERAQLEGALERNTGVGRVRATDAGATFTALAERERALEVVEREAAAERALADARADAEREQRRQNNLLAERAQIEAALERNTGLGRQRAVDAGATVSALTHLVNKEHEAAQASDQMDREARELRATLDPLAGIQERFNASLARFRTLAAAGKISADELAAAEAHLADEANRARAAIESNGESGSGSPKLTLFGLKPYELQNLSYQINDVVTGLASGQRVTQIIAQQGGQILQLFPQVAGRIVGALSNPAIAAFVVTIGTVVLGLKEAADQAERLREYSGQLSFRADGGSYDASALAQAEHDLKLIGASAEDAEKAIKALLDESVDPERLDQFARAAQNTAQAFGTDLAGAAQQIAEAFTGGFDAVAALDDKMGFLTASEREHIKELFNEGNAQAARTEALNAYSRQAQEAADKQRGPWAEAATSLGKAWDSLIRFIADSLPVRATIAVLNELAGVVKSLGDGIADALGDEAPADGAGSAKIAQVQAQIRQLRTEITQYEEAIAKKSPIAGTLQRLMEQSRQQLADAEKHLAQLERSAPDTLNGDANGSAAKRRAERLSELNIEQQIQNLRNRGQQGLNEADSRRRVQLAGEIAFRDEMKSTGDAIVAARLKEIAIAKEAAEVDKQNEAARKTARQERERAIQQFERRVVGAEGGTAKNPFSSAKGYGQFTERTFIDVYGRTPGADQSLGREQILALRNNERVARGVIDQYARENARFLERFGAKVTAGNLYLTHFLGPSGAKAVLQANPNTSVDQVIRRNDPRSADQVLNGNRGYLRTENGRGRYRTAGELRNFISGRVGDTGAAQTGLVEEQARIEQSNVDRQNELNRSIRQGNEDRQQTIDSLEAQNGLYGTALIAEQRRQAVAQAELDLRQKAEDANRNLKPGETAAIVTQEQVDRAKELAGALFDAQHAREALSARLADAQRPLDDLERQRDLLRDQEQYLLSIGDFESADAVNAQLRSISGDIQNAYDALIEFYRALNPDERVKLGILTQGEMDIIIAKLERARDATQEWGRVAGISARSIADVFASTATDAFMGFIKRVAEGQNVFKALAASIREFAANFILAIAQMIVKLLAYAAAVAILRALGVPIPGQVSVHHAGGIAGSAGGTKRSVAPALFAAAVRYHTGGIAGLAPDEVPAVLKRGEEVLTEGDPRHRANGGLSSGGDAGERSLKVVNAFDLDEVAEQMLTTKRGERAVLNMVRRNRRTFQAALQG